MASNSHRKRRTHVITPAERSSQAASTEGSPPKRARPSNRSKNNPRFSEFCRLGLRRIVGDGDSNKRSQEQDLGPLIRLCHKMYLGRTPPTVSQAMAKTKPLDATWKAEDFDSFYQNQSIAKKHALLGIDRGKLGSKEDEILKSVSRKLLHVHSSTSNSITLQRGPESVTGTGKRAHQVSVVVHRCPRTNNGVENENNSNSSGERADNIHVRPNAKIILREGNVLVILNTKYRYKVVNAELEIPKSDTRGTSSLDAIDLLESSGGSSGSDNLAVACLETRSSPGSTCRQSLSSVNDRTVVLPEDGFLDNDIQTALKLSLESRKQRQKQGSQEVIEVETSSSNNSEDEKPKSRPLSKGKAIEKPTSKETQDMNLNEKLGSRDNETTKPSTINDTTNNDEPNQVPKTRRSSRLRKPAENYAATTNKSIATKKTTTKKAAPKSLLRQKGLRIQAVLVQEAHNDGNVVEKPIKEIIRNREIDKQAKKAASETLIPITGPVRSLEAPTKGFWDSSWNATGDSTENTIASNLTSTTNYVPISPLTNPSDTPTSDAAFYWNALNSSRPREGACYFHSTFATTVPGPLLCEKWMNLLTWGNKASSWDGPRMDFLISLWKNVLGRHPKILLSRMIGAAPGGASEWWKTCLTHDDLADAETSNEDDEKGFVQQNKAVGKEAAQLAINGLRMRSSRLEAFLYLLESNIAFEKEQTQREVCTRTNTKNDIASDEDSSSDEEDKEDREVPLALLAEIRSFGIKPVLRLVAQAMSKFWVSQRNYLGYMDRVSDIPEEDWSLEQERSEMVQTVARDLAHVLSVLRRILESKPPTSRRRRRKAGATLSDRDVGDILWNSMDLEVRERLPKRPNRKVEEKAFLVEWISTLRESIGEEFASELGRKVGVTEHYEELWDL